MKPGKRVLELHLGVEEMQRIGSTDAELIDRVGTLINGAAGATLAHALYDKNGQFSTGNTETFTPPATWITRAIVMEGNPDTDDVYLLHGSQIGDLVFVSGRNLHFIRTAKYAIIRGVTMAGFMVVLAMIGTGYLMSNRSQRKFEHIEHTLERVADGDSSARIGVAVAGDQIDRIPQKIDLQLAKLEATLEGTRRASAAVAHDLRKPLARVSLQLEQGLTKAEAGQDVRADLEDAVTRLLNLNAVISTILRITRIESHDLDDLKPFNLTETLDEIVSAYEAVAEDAGQILIYTPPKEPLCAIGDADMIAQLVINLLQNVITHACDGARITLDAIRQNRQIILSLSDTGPSIPEDLRGRVFDTALSRRCGPQYGWERSWVSPRQGDH